jgi:hypothetical protein
MKEFTIKFINKTPADIILDALRSALGPDREEEKKLRERDKVRKEEITWIKKRRRR